VFASRLIAASQGGERELGHYQATFMPMIAGVGLAILLTFLLRETGPGRKSKRLAAAPAENLALR